jgi:hypothetical protein
MFHLLFLGFLYFLPTILATRRGHDVMPILLLNFFLGWTGIGWLILFIWALCSYPYPGHYQCYDPRYNQYYCAPPPPPPGPYDPGYRYWRNY